jgi:hypothetical protein
MMSNLPTAAGSLDLQVILEIVRVTWVVVVHAIHRRSVENFDEPVQRQGFYTLRMNFKNSVGDLPLNTPDALHTSYVKLNRCETFCYMVFESQLLTSKSSRLECYR